MIPKLMKMQSKFKDKGIENNDVDTLIQHLQENSYDSDAAIMDTTDHKESNLLDFIQNKFNKNTMLSKRFMQIMHTEDVTDLAISHVCNIKLAF